ncbi:MAG: alpha/beta fold hydrolase [Cyanobacteriota bacterium]|nr:alpha/beta fold hydrolase [Cyanobacteriota bacterium]
MFWFLPVPGSNARHRCFGVVASLLLAATPVVAAPARAAEVLELQLDGMAIPINLAQLEAWSRNPDRDRSELAVWLSLLDPRSRRNLVQLLNAPLLQEKSLGEQLLTSWTGEQLLAEVAELLQPDPGSAPGAGSGSQSDSTRAAALLRQTLVTLLSRERQVTTLQLLRAIPAQRVSLRLDGLIVLAAQWREQLQLQRQALQQLGQLGLPLRQSQALALSHSTSRASVRQPLAVGHRGEPLPLQIWPADRPLQGPWVVLMPGLGGDGDQLSWLAAGLARWGWPVVVLDHPGSDERALKAAMVGLQHPPGADSLDERLADVAAVVTAQRAGKLRALNAPPGAPVVLMGHSLGGLTALLAAGLQPEAGLPQRCRQSLKRLPLTNLSRLLQCQLPQDLPHLPAGTQVAAVVAYNGFGSLLWPAQGTSRLAPPVLLAGGSLDLITPPLSEQLGLFAGQRHPRSRLLLLEGGSHFSPVRVGNQQDALFQLGEDLVGISPRAAQDLLLPLTIEFLQGLQQPLLLSPQIRMQNGIRAHVLDGRQARRWQQRIKTPAVDPAAPPARQP